VLESLLAPRSPLGFVSEDWEARSFVVRGDAAKVERLLGTAFGRAEFFEFARRLELSLSKLQGAAGQHGEDARGSIRASFDLPEGESRRPMLHVGADQIDACLRSGASVQLGALGLLTDAGPAGAFARFAGALRRELNFAGELQIGATYSPRGGGFEPHFDPTGAFIWQTAGRKRYRFGTTPLVRRPRQKAYVLGGRVRYVGASPDARAPWELPDPDAPAPAEEEIELGPGDLVYLPAGAVHSTRAEQGDSIALLIIFGQTSPSAFFAALLDRIFSPLPEWRSLPPFLSEEASAEGELPERVARFFDARRVEASRLLAAAKGDGLEVAHALLCSVAGNAAYEPEGSPPRQAPLSPDARLTFAGGRPLLAKGRALSGQRAGFLLRAGREAELSAEALPLVERMTSRASFSAREICDDDPAGALAWARAKPLLEALLEGGFLERVEGETTG
jgi:Cupin superfamily protein